MRIAGLTLVTFLGCNALTCSLASSQAVPPVPPAPANAQGEMVLIPGGVLDRGIEEAEIDVLIEMGRKVPHIKGNARFWYGDEIPRHRVAVDSFWIDAYEVTNHQFQEFVDETSYEAEGPWEKHASLERTNHPVLCVTWNDAAAYAAWAGKRLPTEAEWEYAAKGGRDVRWFPWGDEVDDGTHANYNHKGETFFSALPRLFGFGGIDTTPVGSYPSNGYGLYDLCGNASEWVDAEHRPYPGGPTEGVQHVTYAPPDGRPKRLPDRVFRGGSWQGSNPVFMRVGNRGGARPDSYHETLGFRCARSL